MRKEIFKKISLSIIGAMIGVLGGFIFAGIIFFWFTGMSFKMSGAGEGIFVTGVILAVLFILSFMVYGAIKGFKYSKKELKQGNEIDNEKDN